VFTGQAAREQGRARVSGHLVGSGDRGVEGIVGGRALMPTPIPQRLGVRSTLSSLAKLLRGGVSSGAPLTARLCAPAAGRGDLAQLAWLRWIGCPWVSAPACVQRLTASSPCCDRLWRTPHGCPPTCLHAADGGQLHVEMTTAILDDQTRRRGTERCINLSRSPSLSSTLDLTLESTRLYSRTLPSVHTWLPGPGGRRPSRTGLLLGRPNKCMWKPTRLSVYLRLRTRYTVTVVTLLYVR
jgi:hypothetical protein